MKQCSFCGNKRFSDKKVQHIYRHDGKWMIFNDVPCEQCDYCGEQYFAAAVLKKIEADFLAIHKAGRKARKRILVPCEDFAMA